MNIAKSILSAALFLLPLATSDSAPISAESKSTTVYICTGSKATTYHTTNTCRGLGRCSGEVKATTPEKATELGRRPCKICTRKTSPLITE